MSTCFEKVEITPESDTFSLGGGMEIPKQLIECLDENKVSYEVLHHPEAVTAQRIAQAEHVKGRHHAKVVIVKSGDEHLMMVLPADHHIDLDLQGPVRSWSRRVRDLMARTRSR